MNGPYEDIINLEYQKSDRYPHMPLRDRAAQFAPFSALTGYSDVVDETGRITDYKRELDEYEIEEINRELQYALENIEKNPIATFIYFIRDKKKSGGAYRTVKERIDRIDEYSRTVLLVSGEVIPIGDIFSLVIDKDKRTHE